MSLTEAHRLLMFTEGRFGQAVAERVIADVRHVAVFPLLAALPRLDDLLSRADFVGLALWRRYPSAVDAVDVACGRRRVPWSSVTLDGRFLIIGPLVVPGVSPCYACYRRRWSTHLARPEREQALDGAYDADNGVGCKGFPPSSVTIAAAALALDRAEAGIAAGRVRRLDLLHCALEETRVVRVHGCERCSQPTSSGERYVRHLRAALAADARCRATSSI